ncbi:threonine synthase [Anaeromyxobacter terrae]|uniref:threonine synthase n=1 Tax=Anaeromyxobacter terrae TaxID=2925406 RepID=UPI001F594019|nr:threonine synthase [Anaeromyxobacter sp. SG22]
MSSSLAAAPRAASAPADPSRPELSPLVCRRCGARFEPRPVAVCEECIGPLEPAYAPERTLPTRWQIEARPRSIWRYREWLPILGEPVLSLDTGFTPLLDSPALARALGVRRALVKNDAVSHPTQSFKDRVVAVALNAAAGFGLETVGCASTGNLANAVAAQAARAGLAAWIFIPEDLELAKIVGTAVYGPRLVRVRGTYDDVNRLCVQVADRFGWGLVNLNLRSYYGEGSKTMAFEIAEQLGWRLPDAVIAPMAGGSLVTKLDKGFHELADAHLVDGAHPRMFGAQAAGCAPIVNLFERGGDAIEPVVPRTIARSIAIGNPADGAFAARAIRSSGGAAAAVTDEELVRGIRLLAETTGVFTETAGGVTVAAALKLAREGKLRAHDEVVLCITGNGLKTIDAVVPALPETPVISAKLREVAALVDA